ncbi:MAG: hypothetical protein Kow0062_15780 [Acidobacteriota bacterium]|nr:MAG: hypothetical protein D6738_06380 [Acidobacteriota bacterium]
MGRWTARQVLAAMPRERRVEAIRAFWDDPRLRRADRIAALEPWLRARGMRAAFLDRLPRARRAELMADTALPEDTAHQVLMSWHLVRRRPLLERFLDLLGIEHDEGVIEHAFEPPAAEDVSRAIDTLRQEFDAEDVETYLRTLTASDPVSWAAVAERIEDPGT